MSLLAGSVSTRGSCSRRDCACSRSSATKRGSSGPRGRRPGRISQVNALTSWMWTFGSSAMCARSFAESPVDEARAAPVVRQPDLVDGAAVVHPQRPHPLGDEDARLDRRARGVDRRPAAVLEPDFARELRDAPRRTSPAAARRGSGTERRHAAGRVVLGQPVRRDDVRIDLGARLAGDRVVRILGEILVLLPARVRALRVERVRERRLVRLVVRRQRPVLEALRRRRASRVRRPA